MIEVGTSDRSVEPGVRALRQPLGAQLYLVASPIGNLADVSLRALDVLRRADIVACEDSRITKRLLRAHGIDRPLLSYHEHNAARVRPRLIEALKSGKSVALVPDAGTPLVSDPGYRLVQSAIAEGLAVTAVPGASAALAALTLSGLPSDRFFFAGFLPARTAARRATLAGLAAVPATLIFFEAARRLPESLEDMAASLGGERPAAIARELTKLHEELRRGCLADLARHYRDEGAPKGEVVVLVGAPDTGRNELGDEDLDARLRAALAGASLRDAAAQVAAESGLPKRRVYARALALARQSGDAE